MSTSSISREELLQRRLRGLVKPRPAAGIQPVPRGGALPLSFAQRRLWVLDQIQPGSTEYLMPMLLRLRGELDEDALRRALDEVVARHEVLRTRYAVLDGEPVQLVDPPAPVPFDAVDLRDPAGGAAEHRLAELVAREGARPFDLAADWPVRAMLARLPGDERALLLTLHHIASDGWSESVLLAELDALYGAFAAGNPSPLPPLAVQYADFAAWQREQLSGAALDEQLAYWRGKLAGLAPLELRTDRPRGPVRGTDGATESFTVPAELAGALTRLGRAHGATPFMVLLAAFKVLLARYAGQADVVVGSPVAGRDKADVAGLIGLFVNTVVLRTDLSGDVSFIDVLARVRETALDAYAHQHTPFERLVAELAPERDASRNPLFQVVFSLAENAPTALTGLPAEQQPAGWSMAKFDLGLAMVTEPDGSLSGYLEYATALFDAATVRRMAGHLVRLLESIAADPAGRVRRLELLPDAEREQVLHGWHGAGTTYPTAPSLPEAFRLRVERDPGAVAVTCGGDALTYAELNARANRLAHRLVALGVGPDTLVGVCLDRGVDLVVALLGVLKAGAGYLPLDPGQPADRLAYMLDDAAVPVVVGRGDLAGPAARDGVHRVLLDDPAAGDWPDTDPVPTATGDDVAYVIYTSGSTGRPKGVPVTHRNVLRLLRSAEADFGFGPADVWTMFHSYAFDFSVWELWGALLGGGRVVVVPFAVSRSPREFLDLLVAEGVTVLNQTPSAFRGLIEAVAEADLAPSALALRTVVFGGEALDVADLAPWFARFGDARPVLVNMYGITETTVHVTYRPIRAGEAAAGARSPIGRPLGDLRTYLLDDELQPVPIGVPGQIYVSGAGLARGYLGRPALTAERFGPDPYALTPGARMYRTGDLARLGPDGDLEFLGRVDDQVKIRGHRIEPGEVEAAVTAHPGVEASVVVAHRRAGEREARLVAYVVPRAGSTVEVAELRAHLGRVLPAYMVPALFVPLDALPVTANGKADRKALPDPDLYRAAPAGARVAPRNPVEQIVAETWAEVLGLPEVGVHDNFFALGGDSIRAIKVVGALRPRGVQLTVQDLLVHQTIDGLAACAASAAGAPAASAEERRVAPFELLGDADRAALPPGLADAYPLAMVQAAMVYQMVADRDESPYHNITLFPMADDAPFALPALRAAATLLGRRHEILRTSFDLTRYTEPLQLVHVEAAVEVGYDDLRGLPAEAAQERVAAFAAETRRHPFDVTQAPMVRFHVHQTADDRWTFSFIECHAVLDGWSHHSLIDELLKDYRAIRDGAEPRPVSGPSVRYADYVAAEKRSLASEADRAFWHDRLDRFDRLELPEGWAAEPGHGELPYLYHVPFADLDAGLRRLAAAAGVPLKSVLFAAHLTVLGAIGGARRFHTGLVGNGRLETSGGELVRGMHLNTLPVGADLTAATWTELARRVFAEEVAVHPHRRFPLPEMQRAWGGGTALVETAFTYLDFHVLDASRIESGKVVDVSPNEFALDVWTFPGMVHVAGRPDRISRANGARLAAMYRRVLEAMATDPDGDARAGLVDADEAERLLAVAEGPRAGYPDRCLHELFEEQVTRTPAAVALRCADGTEVGYAELNARANRLARHLRDRGVGTESRVGVLLRRGPDLVVALLAVLKAGGAYLPLDPRQPARRLVGLLDETGAAVVVTTAELAGAVRDAAAAPLLLDGGDGDGAAAQPADDLGRTAPPDALAYVVYTSGSTGTPKGVMITHRNVVNYVAWCLDAYTPLGGTGAPLYSSMAFDLPVTSLFPALLSGQPVTLTEDDGTAGVDALVAALERGGFGLLKLTPSHLAVLNQSLSADGVRRATGRLVAGGEELAREMVSSWARHAPDTVVDNEYGPTETTVGCSWLEGTAADLAAGVLPIGRPNANTTMRVLDADLRLVPVGVVGELYIGGAQVARGYVGRPDLTAEKFVPDPFATEPGRRLYRTGDLARHRPDGVLEFAGRVDDQVKVRGYRIELGEVETALRRHADLRSVAVCTRTTPSGEKELVAWLAPAEGAVVDAAALPGLLAQSLPDYMIPAGYVVLDELPMTPSGKVDTAALPAPEDRPRTRVYTAPRTAVENILARAWTAVLRTGRVGVDDSFVELGGHSMAVMRVIVKLREEHGIRLSFRDFYEHRTIAELARLVEANAAGDAEPLDAVVWLRRGGTRPPLFCVHPGSAHWFAALAEHLDPDQPVAAFEWPGLSRRCAAPESIEQIAELNLAQLRRVAPTGPYRLLGWCGGSQITTEMARRLHAQGEDVTFILLDPALDTYERENMREFMARFHRAEALLAAVDEAGPDELPAAQQAAVAVLEVIVDDGRVDPPAPGDDFWPSRVRVWRELLQTRMDYRHWPYPGRLHLIAGDELAAGEHEVSFGQSFADYAGRWAELATGGLELYRVGGNHLGVLRAPHVGEVARVLTGLLGPADGTDTPQSRKDVK